MPALYSKGDITFIILDSKHDYLLSGERNNLILPKNSPEQRVELVPHLQDVQKHEIYRKLSPRSTMYNPFKRGLEVVASAQRTYI